MENNESYFALDIAKWIISNIPKKTTVTHLKIQKLLYFSEAWVQTILEKELFKENIEAWAHGPVIPNVYYEFRTISNKDDKLDLQKIQSTEIKISEEIIEVLKYVIKIYGKYSGLILEDMTHKDKPWIDARKGLDKEARSNNIIDKQNIKKYYQNKYKEELYE